MDIQTLRTFLELTNTRHFGKTSERLFITQSAVSARIRQLEMTLGVKLFIRHPRNLSLTESGRKLIPFANTIVSTWEQARLKVSASNAGARYISLGSIGSFWDAILQDWFNLATKSNTDTVFQIQLESNANLVQQVLNGTLDIAFVYDPPHIPHLKIETIHNLSLSLYCSSRGEKNQQEIIKNRYILVDWGAQFLAEHHGLISHEIIPMARVQHGRIALSTITSVGGAAYLPGELVAGHIQAAKCHLVPGTEKFVRTTFAIFRDDNPEVEWLSDLSRKIFGQIG